MREIWTIFQKDGSEWQTFRYSALGELTDNIRIFSF